MANLTNIDMKFSVTLRRVFQRQIYSLPKDSWNKFNFSNFDLTFSFRTYFCQYTEQLVHVSSGTVNLS